MNRVVFVGGNSKMLGFPERIIRDFEFLWKNNLNFYGGVNANNFVANVKAKEIVKVVHPNIENDLMSYSGLWLLSQIIQPEQYITHAEYKECGADILKRKNLSKAAFL